MDASTKQVIEKLHENKVILRKGPEYPDGFTLKSGKKSDIYINIRDLIKKPSLFGYVMHQMFQLLANKVKKSGACIMGIPTMGAVISPIMAYKLSVPLAVIRQHKKDHGVGHEIEGILTNKIIVIDDVITSGSSIKEAVQKYIEPIFGQDYELDVYVIIDREQHSMSSVHSLATLTEIKHMRFKKK
jgi:orotate phosphoribosyltransferase